MIELRNKRALVVGLARSGRAVASRLRKEGAVVTATDLRPPCSFGAALKDLMERRIGFELGVHREETFLKQDLIVVSPGVPWDLPQLEAARRRKITVVPEVEAASWFFQGTLAGITGTNGKTTTTTLLGRMLEASGFPVHVAGNIGVPLISAVDLFSPDSIVVAELSSFQLEAIRSFHPHLAVLLNVTENHLDRHRTFAAYVSAKAQIFRNQQADDFALLNADDPVVMSLAPVIASRKVFFSLEQDLPEGVLLSQGKILYRAGHLERMLMEAREIRLRGAFNIQNVMAAAAAACILGADFNAIRTAVREFTGVEHRIEYVRTVRGVDFFNDSKATTVDATCKALSTFECGVHLILGGKDKGSSYTPLRQFLEGRVKSVYLIGAAAERIAEDLDGVDLHRAGTLNAAAPMAFARAISGDVVLLSPACSSYDQFENFEQRGRVFKELVEDLPNTVAPGSNSSPNSFAHPASGPASAPGAPESSHKNLTAPTRSAQPSPSLPVETTYVYETGAMETPAPLEAGGPGETDEMTRWDAPAPDTSAESSGFSIRDSGLGVQDSAVRKIGSGAAIVPDSEAPSPHFRAPNREADGEPVSYFEVASTQVPEGEKLPVNSLEDSSAQYGQGRPVRNLELFPSAASKSNSGEEN